MKIEIFLDVPYYAEKSNDCIATTYPPSKDPDITTKRYQVVVEVELPFRGESVRPLSVKEIE